ncbi:hypothetical protein ACWCSD_36335 [Nonomuraea sp. NPDC001684]
MRRTVTAAFRRGVFSVQSAVSAAHATRPMWTAAMMVRTMAMAG